MKSDKRQTLAMIGISLLVIAGVIMYISLTQPKIYSQNSDSVSDSQMNSESTSSALSVSDAKQSENTTQQNNSSSAIKYPLNINKATVQELMTIDGLGEKRAYAIVAYREQIGSYTDVSQIMNIKGIGDSLYSKISPYLTV